jgi:hypothetical protein
MDISEVSAVAVAVVDETIAAAASAAAAIGSGSRANEEPATAIRLKRALRQFIQAESTRQNCPVPEVTSASWSFLFVTLFAFNFFCKATC